MKKKFLTIQNLILRPSVTSKMLYKLNKWVTEGRDCEFDPLDTVLSAQKLKLSNISYTGKRVRNEKEVTLLTSALKWGKCNYYASSSNFRYISRPWKLNSGNLPLHLFVTIHGRGFNFSTCFNFWANQAVLIPTFHLLTFSYE